MLLSRSGSVTDGVASPAVVSAAGRVSSALALSVQAAKPLDGPVALARPADHGETVVAMAAFRATEPFMSLAFGAPVSMAARLLPAPEATRDGAAADLNSVGGIGVCIATGDLTGDGRPDLAIALEDGNVLVLAGRAARGAAGAVLMPPLILPSRGPVRDLRLIDIDGDGRRDVVVATDLTTWHVFPNLADF